MNSESAKTMSPRNKSVSHSISNTSNVSSITSMALFTMLVASPVASGLSLHKTRTRLTPPGSGPKSDDINPNGFQKTVRIPPTTELLYSHGDYSYSDDDQRRNEHHSAVDGLKTRMSSIWSTVFPASQVDEDDPQAVVDEYLEFLDRRYHRLHDEDDTPTASPAKPFLVWDWLMEGKSEADHQDSVQNQEDALFVLGVAELASERLLQRRHSPASNSAFDKASVIDTKATTISPSKSRNSSLFGTLSQPSISVLQQVKERRRALISYQEKQMKRVLLASFKAVVSAPRGIVKAAEAVWRYGGGKKTFALTLGVLTGVFLLMRPALAEVVGVVFE